MSQRWIEVWTVGGASVGSPSLSRGIGNRQLPIWRWMQLSTPGETPEATAVMTERIRLSFERTIGERDREAA